MDRYGIGTIKGLWGEDSGRRRQADPVPIPGRVDAVFCYGGRNKIHLRDLGYEPIKLHDNPRVGNKFKLIAAAFQHFPQGVLWLDWDVKQIQTDVEWLYHDLAIGKPLRASLYLQSHPERGANWRVDSVGVVDGSRDSITHTLGCGFLYFRYREVAEQAVAVQQEFPQLLDHQVLSLLFDRLHGGWMGAERFRDEGWHTQGYYYNRQLFPPRRSQIAFLAGQVKRRRMRI